jgi:hypothetical protein
VDANPTGTILSASPDPSPLKKPVTYTAIVSPVPDGGTRKAIVPICSSIAVAVNGEATCPLTFTKSGHCNVTVTWSGSAAYLPSSVSLVIVVKVA